MECTTCHPETPHTAWRYWQTKKLVRVMLRAAEASRCVYEGDTCTCSAVQVCFAKPQRDISNQVRGQGRRKNDTHKSRFCRALWGNGNPFVQFVKPVVLCRIKPTGWFVLEVPLATQQRSEETRSRILQTALSCFAERGYDATGVAEICQRAGVSKGAFYHHFASKQALFVALLDRWLAALDGQMAGSRAPGVTAPQALQALVGLLQQALREARGQLPMFLEFWRQAARDETIWRGTMEPFKRYRSLLAGIVRQGIAEESLRPCDPDDAARTLVSMAAGMVLQSALDPTGNDWELSAQAGIDMLLHGLLRSDT